MTTALKQAFDKAAQLSDSEQEAFARFLLEELEFLDDVQKGIDAANRGDVRTVEEVRRMLPEWISKSSSRAPR